MKFVPRTQVLINSFNSVISVQSVSPANQREVPGTSTVTPAGDFDWLYASWLCNEVDPA